MSIANYYKNATMYPAIAAILLTIAFSVFDNRNYKSEWLTSDAATAMCIVEGMVITLILCALCLPIFLVRYEVVKNNKLLTILSWFMLPVFLVVKSIAQEISFDLEFNEKIGSGFIFGVICVLPFFIGLIWSYVQYTKELNRSRG